MRSPGLISRPTALLVADLPAHDVSRGAKSTLNLCAGDAGWANAVNDAHTNSNPHPIKGIVRKYLWKDGVSDHYPVKFTLQVT
jgi:hypothetical protein